MSQQVFLECKNIKKSFGGIEATKGLNLKLYKSQIIGLIGPNGAGKTTAFNLITGHIKPDSGSVVCRDQNITNLPPHTITRLGITRTWQNLRLFNEMTVEENLLLACQDQPGENIINTMFRLRYIKQKELENKEKVAKILKQIDLEDKSNVMASELSYAEQKLLVLGRGLVSDAECILLDEPMSGMDDATLEKTKSLIKSLAQKEEKAVCIIEHNVDFIFETCNTVLFLNEGQVISEGTPDEIKNNEDLTNIYFGS